MTGFYAGCTRGGRMTDAQTASPKNAGLVFEERILFDERRHAEANGIF